MDFNVWFGIYIASVLSSWTLTDVFLMRGVLLSFDIFRMFSQHVIHRSPDLIFWKPFGDLHPSTHHTDQPFAFTVTPVILGTFSEITKCARNRDY